MNYRHAFHAGNFADVLKHVALVALLRHLRRKEKPFAVIDTHAGRGLYELSARAARRTKESDEGIGRLHPSADDPPALAEYLALARGQGEELYPGSPLIAVKMLRPSDRLIAIEKHPEEFSALARALAQFRNARAVEGDGYAQLRALLPPPQRRGLVIVDPPYESDREFLEAARALIDAHRRFATGIYLLWHPLKSGPDIAAATGEILNAGVGRLSRIVLDVGRPPGADPERLSASGLLVVNPPFGFDAEMRRVLDVLGPRLRQGDGAGWRVERLAGEEAES